MRFYASWHKAFCLILATLSAGLMALAPSATSAAPNITANSIRLTPSVVDDANKRPGWDLQADFQVELPTRLAELAKSTPLYFVLEWRMSRGRWYWLDEKLATGQLYWRLTHNPLTQQWRMSAASTSAITDGRFALSYNSLDEALGAIRRIRRDHFVYSADLQADKKYDLTLRLRLDSSQLPKPFQLNAITNKDWEIDSGRIDYSFVAAAPVSAMVPMPVISPVAAPK